MLWRACGGARVVGTASHRVSRAERSTRGATVVARGWKRQAGLGLVCVCGGPAVLGSRSRGDGCWRSCHGTGVEAGLIRPAQGTMSSQGASSSARAQAPPWEGLSLRSWRQCSWQGGQGSWGAGSSPLGGRRWTWAAKCSAGAMGATCATPGAASPHRAAAQVPAPQLGRDPRSSMYGALCCHCLFLQRPRLWGAWHCSLDVLFLSGRLAAQLVHTPCSLSEAHGVCGLEPPGPSPAPAGHTPC